MSYSLPPLPSAQVGASHQIQPITHFEKVRRNCLVIGILEGQANSTRPPVAYIRGRELFVIKPTNWKGMNFLRQIWYLFNQIIFRYQELSLIDWTQHEIRNRTLFTVESEEYKKWLAVTYPVLKGSGNFI